MTIEFRAEAKTADKISFVGLPQPTPSTSYRPTITILLGSPTSKTWTAGVVKSRSLRVENAVEDSKEEAWKIYLELEARYSDLSRMFTES